MVNLLSLGFFMVQLSCTVANEIGWTVMDRFGEDGLSLFPYPGGKAKCDFQRCICTTDMTVNEQINISKRTVPLDAFAENRNEPFLFLLS